MKKSTQKQQPKKTNALDVLFPEKAVNLEGGGSITVRPLTLADLPKVTDAFARLMGLATQMQDPKEGTSVTAIISEGVKEILLLIPFCIDRKQEEVPATAVPELLEIIVEQNFPEDVITKWRGLVGRVLDQLPKAPPDGSEPGPKDLASTKK